MKVLTYAADIFPIWKEYAAYKQAFVLEIGMLLPMLSYTFIPPSTLLLHPLKVAEMVLEHFLLESSLPQTYFFKVLILSEESKKC